MTQDWYEVSWITLQRVYDANKQLPIDKLRKAFRDAYPFGERAIWPYNQWCKAQRNFISTIVLGYPITKYKSIKPKIQ